MSRIWIVNDHLTTIPGTRTLWHDLCEWLDGEWIGGDYETLAARVEAHALDTDFPDLIIRNATWFGPVNLDVPTIALVQDIMPVGSWARSEQVRVCENAALTVFNSEFTRYVYPELEGRPHRIIPLSVDFDLFRPMEAAPVADVCWIGAPSWVKGWDILGEVVREMPETTFALVLKEAHCGRVPENVRVFNRLPHSELPALINGCSVGLCTSRVETQHLAGIEMGACGLPMVAPNVGCYFGDGTSTPWGERVTDPSSQSFRGALGRALETARSAQWGVEARSWWESRFSPGACREVWLALVEEVRSDPMSPYCSLCGKTIRAGFIDRVTCQCQK